MDIYFERSKEKVLQTVRDKQPSLVIFDLNSGRLAPIDDDRDDEGRPGAAIDPHAGLRVARRLGHHRPGAHAGIDQVLARSAFSDKLGDILTNA